MRPLQFAIYKGMGSKFGAIQFRPQFPHFYCPSCKTKYNELVSKCKCGFEGKLDTREGCIFLEIANTIDKNIYDWAPDKKTVMALSVMDIAGMLLVLEGSQSEFKIMHDPGAKSEKSGQITKNLNLSSPKGIKEGCIVNISAKSGEKTLQYMVPLNAAETKALAVLFRNQLSVCLGWD